MNNVVFVAILAVIVYCILLPSSFEIDTGVFMYQRPVSIYRGISDMSIIHRFHPFMASHKLTKSEKSPAGSLIERYDIEERVPIFSNFTFPVYYEVTMEHAKPNEVLIFNYSVPYAFTHGHVTWTIEERTGHHGPGCYLHCKYRISCPWVTSSFTESKAREAQEKLLSDMRVSLENLEED